MLNETFGFADACVAAFIMHQCLRKNHMQTLKIVILTDSKTVFNNIIRNGSTMEKRLMIDIKGAREANDEGISNEIIWIHRNYNISNAMTKATVFSEFVEVLKK